MVRAVTFDVGYTLVQRRIFPPERWFADVCRLAGVSVTPDAALEGARARKRFEVAHPDSRVNPITQEWLRGRTIAGFRAAGVVGGIDELLGRFRLAESKVPAGWALDPDVPAILEALRQRGVRLGVVSNWNATLRSDLKSLGVGGYFDAIIDSASAGADKPDTRIYDLACAALDVDAEQCVHVGDSPPHDVVMADAIGATPVLYDPLNCLDSTCVRIARLMELVDVLG